MGRPSRKLRATSWPSCPFGPANRCRLASGGKTTTPLHTHRLASRRRADHGYHTVLYLKNVTDKAVYGMVILRSDSEAQYTLPRMPLAPHQTIAIDLKNVLAA